MKIRSQFEAWWESFYETKPREDWDDLYSPKHDYYSDEGIDAQYDAWKASRKQVSSEIFTLFSSHGWSVKINKEINEPITDTYQQILNDERKE